MKIKPVWGRVVVLPDDIDETDPVMRAAKEAGIHVVESDRDRKQMAQVEGALIAVGGNAFDSWNEPIPQPGQRVVFDKYAGFIKEVDGVKYRVIDDTDIMAVVEEAQ